MGLARVVSFIFCHVTLQVQKGRSRAAKEQLSTLDERDNVSTEKLGLITDTSDVVDMDVSTPRNWLTSHTVHCHLAVAWRGNLEIRHRFATPEIIVCTIRPLLSKNCCLAHCRKCPNFLLFTAVKSHQELCFLRRARNSFRKY